MGDRQFPGDHHGLYNLAHKPEPAPRMYSMFARWLVARCVHGNQVVFILWLTSSRKAMFPPLYHNGNLFW